MKLPPLRLLLLAVSLAAPAAVAAEAPIRLACMAYSFGRNDGTFCDAVDQTAQAGAHFIEIAPDQKLSRSDPTRMGHLSDEQIAQALHYAAQAGVQPVSIFLDLPSDEAAARARFAYAAKFHVGHISTGSYAAVAVLEKLADEFGLSVGFHQHARQPDRPEYWAWNPDYMFGFLQERSPRVGVCADTGHWAASGVDSVAAVRRLAGRITALHLKDRASLAPNSPDVVLGTGVNQVAAVLAAIRTQPGPPLVIIEYESNPSDNLAEVTRCVSFVRHLLPPGAVL